MNNDRHRNVWLQASSIPSSPISAPQEGCPVRAEVPPIGRPPGVGPGVGLRLHLWQLHFWWLRVWARIARPWEEKKRQHAIREAAAEIEAWRASDDHTRREE
jgi:hypothetical protein